MQQAFKGPFNDFFLQFKTVRLIWTLSPMVILSFLSLMLLLIFAVYFLCKNCKLPIPPTPRKVTPPPIYSGHLGDPYTGLITQTLVTKKYFSSFLFSAVFQHKVSHCIISKWLRIQKWRQEKNNEIKRSKRNKKLAGKVFSFI